MGYRAHQEALAGNASEQQEKEGIMSNQKTCMTRRTFTKAAGALGGLAAVGAGLSAEAALFEGAVPLAHADGEETIHWSQCNVNCGGNCIFQWHSKDGKALYMETDNIGDPDFQSRACLRGRTMRRWLNSPDRLLYPMKRVGKRGEGKFERISWDEAIDTIVDALQRTISQYGNDAIFTIYATGMYSTTGNPSQRLLNCLGGSLTRFYDYSTNMMSAAMPYMFGSAENLTEEGAHVTLGVPASVYSPYDNVNASSFTEAEAHSDLVVMFGNSPAETRMGGLNMVWDFARVREAVEARGGQIINIDYRLNETSAGYAHEWQPIRTGTDVALCAALAHEWITGGKVDKALMDTYCVGYDEDTMPESARGQHKSYVDYIMGTGYDMVEKTPEWAAPITQISAERIRELADIIASAEAPFICQGWGSQRHTNGETTTRAITMLPLLLGKWGLPGTNTGQREAEPSVYLVGSIPAGDNPVEVSIPCYQWANAVDHGTQMTPTNAGVKGGPLANDIKFIWNYAGNCITNQHGDINMTHDLLQDESKCEFILVWDTVMTDSAKYADILLPDAMRSEQMNMQTQGYAEYYTGLVVGSAAQEPPAECRSSYDVMAEIADRFGKREEFTEGRTQEEWIEYLYEQGREAAPELPAFEDMKEQGVYKTKLAPSIGLEDFRRDPAANPVATPSGKIEIYSETLDKLNDEWELPEGDVIHPIPLFEPGFQGYGSVTDEYPLYCSGFHYKGRTHSSFGFIPELEAVARQQVWINPSDAEPRVIKDRDQCRVKSPDGQIQIEAHVTPRIIPGTIGIPQGAWHEANMDGDRLDTGGCVNTLTKYRPTPLGKGNGPAHSMIVEVTKA